MMVFIAKQNFAKHLNEQARSFGSIHNVMQIIKWQNKGSHLNTIERFYIYAEYLSNKYLNDDRTIFHNMISETLPKPNRPQTPPPHPHIHTSEQPLQKPY